MTFRVLVVDKTERLGNDLKRLFNKDIARVDMPRNAANLVEAVEQAKPHLILMYVEPPLNETVRAVELVMSECPTPVLLLTKEDTLRGAERVLLASGALDVVYLPAKIDVGTIQDLRQQIPLLSRVAVVKHPKGHKKKSGRLPQIARPAYAVVAIAASLGGPKAVSRLLQMLPRPFPAPIVLCQHITPGFSDDLARWLAHESGFVVHEATDGQALVKGEVFVAPSHLHMVVTPSGKLRLDDGAPIGGFKPSCDVLLKSVATSFGKQSIGVVLTGMGRDGAKGLKDIKNQGGHTVAQDQASSVVFGMPREAIALGAAEIVLSLDDIASQLGRWLA